ncbi:FecR protein [Pedobacter steynii]|uniref:FecR protein n=1 Tax=Pedobacter steynii TaxID=430522 RepID=A0A1G9Z4W5_9SPHI|nr:FecR family protein [Pedobacter steynii]NQX39929.1 FecR family protein [Pedobacter steynii]SDN15713.1 FecR protein [Pedobacter steynii]
MKESEFLMLAGKVSDGTASYAELSLYNAYLNFLQKNASDTGAELTGEEVSVLWDKINLGTEERPATKSFSLIYKIAIAASVLMISGLGIYFFNPNHVLKPTENLELVADIQPGGNKAVLTLADGHQVALNDSSNRIITAENGMQIHLNDGGELVYQITDDKKIKSDYNKIETGIGGQYQVILPDGTKVWLNSSSSLRYPTVFNTGERTVELKGEGYFEVTKDKTKPFKVITETQQVEVLGTKFNINAYPEEEHIRTTLLQGSVNVGVLNKTSAYTLKPGEQAVLTAQHFKIATVDTEEFISWKDGYFLFNDEPIFTAMRKLARWYDVEVVYEGDFKDINFGGSVSKSNSLQKTLKVLQSTNKLKFKIEGRRIKIMR